MNPSTRAQIRATAQACTEYPNGSAMQTLGPPPERGEGMKSQQWEAACCSWARSARRYVCEACNTTHNTEDGARECCPPEVPVIWVDPASGKEYACAADLANAIASRRAGVGLDTPSVPRDICPVCGSKNDSPHEAVECCLWKDFAAPVRWQVATALEMGSNWTDELARFEAVGNASQEDACQQ